MHIDAAVEWPGGFVYFFTGPSYVRFAKQADRAEQGWPKAIADEWTGFADVVSSTGSFPLTPTERDLGGLNGPDLLRERQNSQQSARTTHQEHRRRAPSDYRRLRSSSRPLGVMR